MTDPSELRSKYNDSERFRLEQEDVLEANPRLVSLVSFYKGRAEDFALRKGLISISEEEKMNWGPSNEYEAINDLHRDLVGNPDLVFFEVIKNARMHGNRNRQHSTVLVEAAWRKDIFSLTVKDSGKGFGSSEETGDKMGMVVIGDFATQQIQSELVPGGHIVVLKRNLPVKLKELEKRLREERGPEDLIWGVNFDKLVLIRNEILATGKLNLELES